MRKALTLFVRALMWTTIAIVVLAIGLGRSVSRHLPSRHQAAPRYQEVNPHFFVAETCSPRFLDRETGQFVRVDFPAGDTLDYAACSPWCDERGQYHVVGRWMNRSSEGTGGLAQEFGLARYTFPEGRVIDQVAIDKMLTGQPCWVPGLTPRILFVSGDGNIYLYSFEEANGVSPVATGIPEHSQPRRLTWRATWPGLGLVYIKDLIWPSDPRLGGRLIASLTYQDRVNGKPTFLGSQLWCLQLSGDGTAIASADRLIVPDVPDPAQSPYFEERLPSLTTTPEGGLALAYLCRTNYQTLWELRVARVTCDPGTGTPRVRCESTLPVAQDCVAATPIFSTDGRWVYGILRPNPGIIRVQARKFSVAGALSMSKRTPSGSGSGSDDQQPPSRAEPAPHTGRTDFAGFLASRLVEGGATHHAGR